MAIRDPQSLVGQKAYSWDGVRIGRVRALVDEGGPDGPYLIIGRLLGGRLVVPVGAVRTLGDRLVVQCYYLFLDRTPTVGREAGLTPAKRKGLRAYHGMA
jgi:hypothetical protein